MYLNQFTNTKEFWYAHCARTMTKTLTVDICHLCVRVEGEGGGRVCEGRGRKGIPSIFFFLLQNDMIYYSILFQPAK